MSEQSWYTWKTLLTLLKHLPCKMLNSTKLCLPTNTLYLWNPQPGQKTLETLPGTVPVSAFCSVYWGLSLSPPPPPRPSGGIPGKRKIFNFELFFYPTCSQALNDQEHGNNDTRVWSSSNAYYITSDWLKKKERTYNVENTAKLAMQKKGLRKEHVNVGYDSLTAEMKCSTIWEWLQQQNTLLNISSKKSPSSNCSTSLFWMTLASSSSRSAASASFSLKPARNRIQLTIQIF